jgi:hypothetical protein
MPVDPPPMDTTPRLVLPRPPVACVVPAAQPSVVDLCGVQRGPRVDSRRPAWCIRQTVFLGDPSLPTCRPAPVPQRPPAVPAH